MRLYGDGAEAQRHLDNLMLIEHDLNWCRMKVVWYMSTAGKQKFEILTVQFPQCKSSSTLDNRILLLGKNVSFKFHVPAVQHSTTIFFQDQSFKNVGAKAGYHQYQLLEDRSPKTSAANFGVVVQCSEFLGPCLKQLLV